MSLSLPISCFNKIYIGTLSHLKDVSAHYFAKTDDLEKILNVRDMSKGGFTSCVALPFTKSYLESFNPSIFGASEHIYIGSVDLGIQSDPLITREISYELGSVNIARVSNDYVDYLEKINLYIPFCGMYELPTALVMGNDVKVSCKCDLATGNILTKIWKKTPSQSEAQFELIKVVSGNCAIEVPLVYASDPAVLSFTNSIASSLSGATSSALSGNILGAATQYSAGYISSSLNALTTPYDVKQIGTLQGSFTWMDILYARIERIRPTAVAVDYASVFGKPLNETRALNTLTGFTKIGKVHVEGITGATDQEIEMINNQLLEGVIL